MIENVLTLGMITVPLSAFFQIIGLRKNNKKILTIGIFLFGYGIINALVTILYLCLE